MSEHTPSDIPEGSPQPYDAERRRINDFYARELTRVRAAIAQKDKAARRLEVRDLVLHVLVRLDEWPNFRTALDALSFHAGLDLVETVTDAVIEDKAAALPSMVARRALAAADAHDRANSIARIRLDDEMVEKIAERLYTADCGLPIPADRLAYDQARYDQARAVLDLLRNEAL